MNRRRMWAKRWNAATPAPESAYVPGHLQLVHDAANQIVDATGEAQLCALGLAPADWLARLRRVVSLAAALHDIGKCNDHFQGMLKEGGQQTLRHEWVSLLIVDDECWNRWLVTAANSEPVDWAVIRWCIAGHHPKYDRPAPPEFADGPAKMHILLANDDMKQTVSWLRSAFGLTMPPPPLRDRVIDFTVDGDASLNALYRQHYEAEDQYEEFDPPLRRFIAAAKDCLVAADVAGSALPRAVEEDERGNWIPTVLAAATLPRRDDYRRIAASRLRCDPSEVNAKLHGFQREIGNSAGRVTLVKAGCGSGKTVAAYKWAECHCDRRRLYVCYPTTGTATEGFRDYLLDVELNEHLKTNLLHSRRSVDFEHILHADEDRNAEIARIESLDSWRTPVVACTVDAVIGIAQNNRRGLFSWPALAQGGFVFDEIHSYDDKLFDALLHFLAAVRGAPTLLMTASLPLHRLAAIKNALAPEPLIESPRTDDLVEVEERPRYFREEAPLRAEGLVERIRSELQKGGKVLRVCNTVGSAMRHAELLRTFSPIVYHSRFRYIDRVRQHDLVVKTFNDDKPALSVCTQVAEMSLDLSATLLITDLAPVSAMIQRLGRLNRKPQGAAPLARPFIVIDPTDADGKFSPLPYDADDLETARAWLSRLEHEQLPKEMQAWCEMHHLEWISGLGKTGRSQAMLARAWEAFQDEAHTVPRWQSAWLDFGPATPVLELRLGSPNVTVVREQDWESLRLGKCRLAEVALPMPVPPAKRGGNKFEWKVGEFNGVPVAGNDAIHYDPAWGAEWLR